MKTRLLILLFFVYSIGINAQAWLPHGQTQYTNESTDFKTVVNTSNGYLYTAYVDASDNDHLKVIYYDGNNWINLGGNVTTEGNASFPDIKVNPFNNEVWVAYRTDPSAGTPKLMAKSFDGNNWVTEGDDIAYNGETPNEKIILQFDFSSGDAYIAAIYEAAGLSRIGAIVSNNSGAWQNEVLLSNNLIPSGLEYNDYEHVMFATVPNGPGVQATTVMLNGRSSSGNWVGSNQISAGNTSCIGLGTVNNFSTFISLTFENSSNFLKEGQNQLSINSGSQIDGNSIQFEQAFWNGLAYLLYVEDNGDVFVQEYDPSEVNIFDPTAAWTNVLSGSYNVGTTTRAVDIAVSNGEIFITYKDGNSITSRKFDPNFQYPRFYVDVNATGNNDGTSWTNAFTNLQTALDNASNSAEKAVWIAQGVYKPGVQRTDAFVVDTEEINIYGGFNGTEITLEDRDLANNQTILSGDLNSDDDNDISFFNTLRIENSYTILNIASTVNNILVDGITITGGHANNSSGSAIQNRGSAIYTNEFSGNFAMKNCTIKNNVADREGNITLDTEMAQVANITIENCIINNNFCRYSAGLHIVGRVQSDVTVNVNNSLFYENVADNVASSLGFTASSIGIFSNNATVNASIVNNTFTNNYDLGTQSTNDKGTIVLRRFSNTSPSPVLNANVHNNIFYQNYFTSGEVLATSDIGLMNMPSNLINSLTFTHNLTTNEATLAAKTSNLTSNNNISGEPEFKDVSANDYTITAFSAGYNAGDNSVVPTALTTDLAGNNRIINSTVDIGAYEYDGPIPDVTEPTVITQDITIQLDVNGLATIQPSTIDNGSTDDATSQANLIYSLDVSSFDCSNLGTNTVTLTIEDEAGNTASETAVVTVEDVIAPSVLTQDITISIDANGTATLDPTSLDNGSADNCNITSFTTDITTFDCSMLGSNTVTLTATDASGNSATATALVTVEDDTAPTVNTQDITVELSEAGTASIVAEDIDNGSSDNCGLTLSIDKTDFTTADLGTNTITLTAVDPSGNTATATAIVTVEEFRQSQTISFAALSEKTFGDADFELTASASSSLPITYTSSDETVATISGSTVTVLSAGTTTITASQDGNQDFNAATPVSQDLVVLKADQSIVINAIADKQNDAADFDVIASTDSNLPLSYSVISGPATINGATVSLLGETGTVEIEVSQVGNQNFNAASASVSFNVFDDPCLGFVASTGLIQNVSCNGDADGSFEVQTTAGTAPFSYELDGNSQSSNIFDNLTAGNYDVIVTDANQCSVTASITISEPEAIVVTADIINNTSIDGNGSISLTVSGGSSNYTFSWNNGATTADVNNLVSGSYEVTVTDANGCSATESFNIGGVTSNKKSLENAFRLYPVPAKDVLFIQGGSKLGIIQIINLQGKAVSGFKRINDSQLDISNLPQGIYFLFIDGKNGQKFIKTNNQ